MSEPSFFCQQERFFNAVLVNTLWKYPATMCLMFYFPVFCFYLQLSLYCCVLLIFDVMSYFVIFPKRPWENTADAFLKLLLSPVFGLHSPMFEDHLSLGLLSGRRKNSKWWAMILLPLISWLHLIYNWLKMILFVLLCAVTWALCSEDECSWL